MATATLESLVHCSRDILGGEPVFVGTRVPLKNLLDYLAEGHSLPEFLDDFPTVTPEQAKGVIKLMAEMLAEGVHAPAA
jgi:uncharacterized protein (DUF433 family)